MGTVSNSPRRPPAASPTSSASRTATTTRSGSLTPSSTPSVTASRSRSATSTSSPTYTATHTWTPTGAMGHLLTASNLCLVVVPFGAQWRVVRRTTAQSAVLVCVKYSFAVFRMLWLGSMVISTLVSSTHSIHWQQFLFHLHRYHIVLLALDTPHSDRTHFIGRFSFPFFASKALVCDT